MDDTTVDLDAIRARVDAADAIDFFGPEYARAVEASQADVPALLAEVARVQAERNTLAAALDDLLNTVAQLGLRADSRVVLAEHAEGQ